MSRTANTTGDAIDCLITTDDLVNESEFLPEQTKSHRRSTSKYRHEYSSHRSHHRSSTSKSQHYSPSRSPVADSRSYPSRHYRQRDQREHNIPSPSSTRKSNIVKKRYHSPSRSPHERGSSQKYPTPSSSATSEPQYKSKKSDRRGSQDQVKQELSVISEDELTKITEQRNEQSSPVESTNNSNNSKDKLPETNAPNQELEISLPANSTLNESKHIPHTIHSTSSQQNILDAIEMINRYQSLVSFSSNDPTVLAFRQNVKELIEKHLELEKRSQAERERVIKLQELESAEKEKQSIKQSINTQTSTSGNDEASEAHEQVIVKSLPKQANPVVESNSNSGATSETSNVLAAETKNPLRRNGAPTRFSRNKVDPPTSLYPVDDVQRTSATNDPVLHADLKITSSSSSREVRIQHGNNDQTLNAKDLTQDLRSTLNNHRTKSVSSEENEPDSNENIDEKSIIVRNDQIETTNHDKTATTSPYSNSNTKQIEISFEYGGHGNLSASSDNDQNDSEMKKSTDRKYRNRYPNIKNRSHHYSGQHPSSSSSSSTNSFRDEFNPRGRDYFSGYGPIYKGHKNDDLRSRLNGNRHPKGSMYRNH